MALVARNVVVPLKGLRKVRADHRERVHQVAVPRAHVADIATSIRLFHMELHHNGWGVRQRPNIGKKVECQARVHEVDEAYPSGVDEIEEEIRKSRARKEVG